MTGDVDAAAADPAAPEPAEAGGLLAAVTDTLAVTATVLGRLARKLDAESRAEGASVEKVARATAGLARAAIAVLALDARRRDALAAAAPPSEPTDEADMDDADDGSSAQTEIEDADGGGEAAGAPACAPDPDPDPDLGYRLARMAWRLGRGGEVPPIPPPRAGALAGALDLPGP